MVTELMCMAFAVYYEAGNQPLEVQFMVADSVMGRIATKSPEFTDGTICGTVHKGYAKGRWPMIAPKLDNPIDALAWKQAQAVAYAKKDGVSPNIADGVIFFHSRKTEEGVEIKPYWAYADYVCYGGKQDAFWWYKLCGEKYEN